MTTKARTLVSWSSGKDSAWMLNALQQRGDVELVGLVTTFNEEAQRVAMHSVRRELVREQASAIGLPLYEIMLPWPCSNEDYEQCMLDFFDRIEPLSATHFAFGDLYLEEIRDYRIRQLAKTTLEPLFPVWCSERDTETLARQMVDSGLRAVLTCVDTQQLPAEFAGRIFDHSLLDDLPEDVDRCGERGEFHSFCFDGPHLASPLEFEIGEFEDQGRFVYRDVIAKR